MTRGRIYAAAAALAVGLATAVVVGDVTQSCAHSCPQHSLCTGGPECAAGFYWTQALIAGAVAFLFVLVLGLAAASVFRSDP